MSESERLPDGRFTSEHRPPSGIPASRKERPPFPPGHTLRLDHGAYLQPSQLSQSPEVRELVEQLAGIVPLATASDAPAIELLAMTLVRVRRAAAHVERREAEGKRAADKLLRDLRGWTASAHRQLSDLGMTPRSRLALGIDLAKGRDELARHLAEHYGDGDAGGDGGDA